MRAEGWANRPLPFEPKGSMLDYRQALRRALGELDPARGAVLRGRYASRDTRRCDVENLLLYNLGLSAFAHLRPQEIMLTRSLTPAPPPEGDPGVLVHHHRYDLVASGLPVAAGDTIARLAPIPLRRPVAVERSGTTCARVERWRSSVGSGVRVTSWALTSPSTAPRAMVRRPCLA
jgi:hypothetical protein